MLICGLHLVSGSLFRPHVYFDFFGTKSVKIVSETSEANEVSRDRIKVQASLQILRFQNGVPYTGWFLDALASLELKVSVSG